MHMGDIAHDPATSLQHPEWRLREITVTRAYIPEKPA
jgi:hypothetical protein